MGALLDPARYPRTFDWIGKEAVLEVTLSEIIWMHHHSIIQSAIEVLDDWIYHTFVVKDGEEQLNQKRDSHITCNTCHYIKQSSLGWVGK